MTAITMQRMIAYFGTDVARINHALKVYGFAGCIARSEELPERDIITVEIAAILHDIGITEAERKHNSQGGRYQEIEGPPIARNLLADINLAPEALERICYLIGNHHSYHNIDGADFRILVEADFLVNLYEDETVHRSIQVIRKKYFRTKTGTALLDQMFS